jgi:hypothetical protein
MSLFSSFFSVNLGVYVPLLIIWKTLLSPICSCFIHHGVIHLKSKFIHSSCIYPSVQILPFIILSSNIHPSFMHFFQSSMHLSLKFYSVNYHSTIFHPKKLFIHSNFHSRFFVKFFHQSFIQIFHSSTILFIVVFHLSNVHLSSIYYLLNFHSYFHFIHSTHMLTISLLDVKL